MQESKKTLPLVSVVIPCYNGEKFIAATIKSVQHQTYPDFVYKSIILQNIS